MFTITSSSSSSGGGGGTGQDQPQQHHLHQQQLQLQQQQQLLKQQQALLQQAMLHQQAIYHPALLAAMSQIEPLPSGNLPPGFDATSCRSVYVGNIHPKVTEALLAEVFTTIGPLAGCKLIRKEKSSYGFVDYLDHRSAAAAILTLNGKQIFSQPIKVNWAYASGQREDTTGHYNIFVGDLSADVTDASLFTFFSVYPSCSDARVMWDQRTGRSRGFGFVSFRNREDAEKAITEMTGKWLCSRAVRCNWATKSGAAPGQGEEANNASGVSNSSSDGSAALANSTSGANAHQEGEANAKDNPESNSQYTTVYVGNLAHEVTQAELHRQFHMLGVGVIEDVRVQREKGFGFVRYRTHDEAALAIHAANGRIIGGKSIKCSWGTKPTPPGATAGTIPIAAPMLPLQGLVPSNLNQGYTTADLLNYQRQLALAQTGANALLPLPSQQGLGMGSMSLAGLGMGTRTGYEMGLGQHQML